jgi:hypothetical protein
VRGPADVDDRRVVDNLSQLPALRCDVATMTESPPDLDTTPGDAGQGAAEVVLDLVEPRVIRIPANLATAAVRLGVCWWANPKASQQVNIGGQFALVGFLLVLNAAFAGSEIALISLREGQLARLEQRSARGRARAALARQPNRFLSTSQIRITLAGFLASATAAVALAEPLVEPLSFLGRASRPAAILSITLVLTFVTLVFGELAPKRLAMQRAERCALLAARPLTVLARLAAPAARCCRRRPTSWTGWSVVTRAVIGRR